jgi:hypothetical protein
MYLHVIQAYTPAASAFAGVTHSPWINAGLYSEVAFIISKGEGEGTMAITTTHPNAHETLIVSVNNTIGTKPWIRLVTKELQAIPVCGSVVAIALKGRYGTTATAL